MNIYLVGGAVRDGLLGLPIRERDYVVVGADASQLQALGFTPLDPNFPVFRHPETGAEYALARREHKTGNGYKGFVVEAGPDVTLEEDLTRRDLTINAIAQDANGRIIDPLHGQADLEARRFRHITPAFQEDPVRLLRLARFAARFDALGFRVTHETFRILKRMAMHAELTSLFPARFSIEMVKALATENPWRFFDLLHRCGALKRLLPSMATALGTPQVAHIKTLPAFPITVMQRVATQTPDCAIRFAAFVGAVLVDTNFNGTLCRNLQVEKSWIDLVAWTQTWPAAKVMQATPEIMLELLKIRRLLHHPERLKPLIQVWSALDPMAGAAAGMRLQIALQAATEVQTATLSAQGLTGPALGSALHQQRVQAIANALAPLPL